jgi:small subunit ribosomal protein S16
VAVKIKLKRLGKIRAPYYRIVVADARTKRDGRAIEEIGKYHPKAEPSFIEVDSERAQHWLSVGAQPTDPVRKLFEITGDWQKFKGLPGTEGTLKTAAPKEDRKEIFAAAVKETLGDAAPKGKGRSAAAKDGDSAARGGRAAAKDSASGKADKPARARSDEEPGEARAKSPATTAGEAKSADSAEAAGEAKGGGDSGAKGGDSHASAGEAKGKSPAPAAGEAKGKSPTAGGAKGKGPAAEAGEAKGKGPAAAAGGAKGRNTARGGQAKREDAADAGTAEAGTAEADAAGAGAAAAQSADSESASGD